MREVYIMSISRTPIGSLGGVISSLTATQLGSIAAKEAIIRAGIEPAQIQEVIMGNVLSANLGQAPAQQVAVFSGIPDNVPCTTVNKVCASGMKAIMLAAQSIMIGHADIVLAGGMESMSNVPYYLDRARSGYRYGHQQVIDGIIKDGLWDPYKNYAMGNAGELCAREYNISRKDQDEYATESYNRAIKAQKEGWFNLEITPVEVMNGKEKILISIDEEPGKVKFDKIPSLKPAFDKDGTITAANASKINDGASAVILMSADKAKELGLKPLAKITGFADASQAPEWFTTTPAKAIPLALKRAGKQLSDVDYFEINEAFSLVSLVNNKLLNIPAYKANIYGGAVSLGHPIGNSGARIVCTLTSVLKNKNARVGAAGICNGGGGASAIVIENI
jgi:acetyl-CoA C-acetyltransferase